MSRRKNNRLRNESNENSGFKPRPVVARSLNQKIYINTITNNSFTLCSGPAGAGKTNIAIGMSVQYKRDLSIDRIILTRPAVDSGASIGYLPGTMEEKLGPYLVPLFDELSYYIERKLILSWMNNKILEIVPLSMMRGRTFNDSFVILDEAQNATLTEIRMCLTRLGQNSRMVVTGDLNQSDLPPVNQGGFEHCMRSLDSIEGIGICRLNHEDIVRHPLIAKIESALF